jgi:hypothetical protein
MMRKEAKTVYIHSLAWREISPLVEPARYADVRETTARVTRRQLSGPLEDLFRLPDLGWFSLSGEGGDDLPPAYLGGDMMGLRVLIDFVRPAGREKGGESFNIRLAGIVPPPPERPLASPRLLILEYGEEGALSGLEVGFANEEVPDILRVHADLLANGSAAGGTSFSQWKFTPTTASPTHCRQLDKMSLIRDSLAARARAEWRLRLDFFEQAMRAPEEWPLVQLKARVRDPALWRLDFTMLGRVTPPSLSFPKNLPPAQP